MTKPWEYAAAAVLVSAAILASAIAAVLEHRRANANEHRFLVERQMRQILARCHMWAVEGYVIANPDDCTAFDPVAWRTRPMIGNAR